MKLLFKILEIIFYIILSAIFAICILILRYTLPLIWEDFKKYNKPKQQYTWYAKTYHEQVVNQLSWIIIK